MHTKQDTYTAKLDYKWTAAASTRSSGAAPCRTTTPAGTPQFPGQPPNSITLANNKGMATGLDRPCSSRTW